MQWEVSLELYRGALDSEDLECLLKESEVVESVKVFH